MQCAVWITGLPASGKSTITSELVKQLRDRGIEVAVLESDALREAFSQRPAYNELDRDHFYGSLAFIGRVLTEHDIPVVFDATANRRAYRERARQQIPNFIEVFVDCPLETCIARDPKGIYKKAHTGQASDVPGVQAIYEPPERPDVVIQGDRESPKDAARRIIEVILAKGFM